MKELIILLLAILLLAMNCGGIEPVQLSGIGGQTILAQVASTNISGQIAQAKATDLWSWGKIPLNYALNGSEKIAELPLIDDDNIWLATKSNDLGLEMNKYT